jgi:hypothetical protein
MQEIERQIIVDALEKADQLDDDTRLEDVLREDYSGRGMFGDRCFGIVGALDAFGLVLVELTEDGHGELARNMASNVRTDNMGYEAIYYWPELTLTPAEEEES